MTSFPPSPEFAANAVAQPEIYAQANADPQAYWAQQARERLHWDTPFTEVLDFSNPPTARWFGDGELNAAYNAVDRHVEAGNGDRVAIYFEGEPGDRTSYTYTQLQEAVAKAANVFTGLGVEAGDRVAVYLPLIPEAIITMLACARIGAIHSVVFGGFSAEALRSRVDDGEAKLLVTADGSWRRGKPSMLKPAVDEALSKDHHTVENVLVVRRNNEPIDWVEGRDSWWHEHMANASPAHICSAFNAENPLYILYTSGTTGRPKGIVHTTGGYLTQAITTFTNSFDIRPERDVFWCTADVGWVTGHTYVVYGPLLAGATQVIYEGTPDTPHRGRWWEIIQHYGVTVLYTAPTAIRTFMKWGQDIPEQYDLSSLRVLGSVGEAINPEAWRWYREVIGAGTAPIVDTWWQTETGGHMIVPLPGIISSKPGSAQKAVPGISVDVVDEVGESVGPETPGLLVIREPWPAMARTIWKDHERFIQTYWSRFEGMYFAGDGAKFDEDGDIWLLGRVDDVMNVSGHRLSTTEIESSLVAHPLVAEAAVVGAQDATTGEAVVAFVIVGEGNEDLDKAAASEQLRQHVAKEIGAIARPRNVLIVSELPKTRSGKIMRRLLKDVAEGRKVGETTTLADPSVMTEISEVMRSN